MKYTLPLAIVAISAFGWATRWEITPLSNGGGAGGAYMLNRWTGTTYLLYGMTSREVTPYTKPKEKVNEGPAWDDLLLEKPK